MPDFPVDGVLILLPVIDSSVCSVVLSVLLSDCHDTSVVSVSNDGSVSSA